MSSEERDNLITLEALGIANADERARLAEALRESEAGRDDLRRLSDAAASLAMLAEPLAPSPEIRVRLLAALEPEKAATDVKASWSDVRGGTVASGIADKTDFAQPSNVISLEARRAQKLEPSGGRRNAVASPLFAVAAAVAVALLTTVSFYFYNRATTAERALTAAQTENARLTDEVRNAQAQLARATSDTQLIAQRETRLATLEGTPEAPAARARLVFDPRTNRAVIFLDNLPPAPPGKAYQLWYIADGKPLPGIVFTVESNDVIVLRDQAPQGSRDASTFAVTLETANGSTTPQGEKILVGKAL